MRSFEWRLGLSFTKCLLNDFITGQNNPPGKRNKRKKDVIKDADGIDDGNDDGNDLKKKMRTTFTGKQIFELEKSFESKKYLSTAERAELAASLQVTQQQVREGLERGSHIVTFSSFILDSTLIFLFSSHCLLPFILFKFNIVLP